jgi:hypothetical protein
LAAKLRRANIDAHNFVFHLSVLPEMLLHLCMDETGDFLLMKPENLSSILFRKIGEEMASDLLR